MARVSAHGCWCSEKKWSTNNYLPLAAIDCMHARMDKLICKTWSQILCFAEKDKNRQCRMNNCIQISRNKRLFLDLRIMTVLNRASDKLIATGYSNCSDHTNFDTARLKLTVSWKWMDTWVSWKFHSRERKFQKHVQKIPADCFLFKGIPHKAEMT